MRIPVYLSLDTDKHADIIEWLDNQPNRAEAIRIACRAYINSTAIDENNILDAMRRLENSIVEIARRMDDLQKAVSVAKIAPQSRPESNPVQAKQETITVERSILDKLDSIGL